MIPVYYSFRSLAARRLSTGVTVLGLALVVFVFAAVLMLSNGIEAALSAGGSPENVVLLSEGADSEVASSVDRDAARVVSTYPEIATGPAGAPLVAGETVVIVALPRPGGTFTNVTARGLDETSFAIRPGVRVIEGREPRRGTNEVAIGRGLVGRTPGARIGGELTFASTRWPVVGILGAEGSAYETEVWGNGDRIRAAFRRDGYSSVVARAVSVGAVQQVIERIEGDARFSLEARPEDRYWADQASSMATFIRVMGLFVSFVFGAGAVLGAMITMYAQVAARVRELGTLRALGFRRRSVLGSVVIESAILGGAGGLLGASAGFCMRWVKIHTVNFQTFSEVRFGFEPTAPIMLAAVLFGVCMGLVGGLLPALRAARLSILDALR